MKIAILEDNQDRRTAMETLLADRFGQHETHFFDEAREMIEFLDANLGEVILVCLDHDLELKPDCSGRWIDPGTGRDVADYLARKPAVCPVVIHTTNSPAAVGMEMALWEAKWRTRRVTPYGDLTWIPTDWFRAVRRALMEWVRSAGDLGKS